MVERRLDLADHAVVSDAYFLEDFVVGGVGLWRGLLEIYGFDLYEVEVLVKFVVVGAVLLGVHFEF